MSLSPSGPNGKPKRKRVQSHSQRKAANVRERRRMFHLNEAFDELRKRLPAFNYEKRLSRIETLRLAMTYISFMKEVSVGQDPKCVKLKPHGADLGADVMLKPHVTGEVMAGGDVMAMTSQQQHVMAQMPRYAPPEPADRGMDDDDDESDDEGDDGSSHSG